MTRHSFLHRIYAKYKVEKHQNSISIIYFMSIVRMCDKAKTEIKRGANKSSDSTHIEQNQDSHESNLCRLSFCLIRREERRI